MKLFSKSFDLKNRRSRWKNAANGAHAPQAIAAGAGSVAPCLPFPPACAKGRHTLSRAGQAGLQKTYAEPTALSGNPRRGFPAKSLPQEAFSTLLRLPKATKAAGASPPHPYKPFEKGLSENFTCLHPTCAEGPALAERKKAACS